MFELKITRNYALALFENSAAVGLEEKVLKQMLIINTIFKEDEKLNSLMCSPVISSSIKNKILAALPQITELDKMVEHFLALLVRKSRFNLIGPITKAFSSLYSEKNGIKYVKVISASTLDKEEIANIKQYLEKRLDKTIKIKSTTNEKLIGGILIKYDSNLIDCSVKGALERVEKIAKGTQI